MGYVIPPKDDEYDCRIGVGKSEDNFYRLGVQFLKNFYTVLDFEKDEIMIGAKGRHSAIVGDESLLYKEPELEPIPDPPIPDPPTPEPTPDDKHEDDHKEDDKSSDDEEKKPDDKSDDDTSGKDTPISDNDDQESSDD